MKRTPKQRVKKKFPNAYAQQGLMSGNWYIYAKKGEKRYQLSGGFTTPKQAWADAAASRFL